MTFEEHVAAALDSLPPKLAAALVNLAVVVEDENEEEPALYGLYEGVPRTEYGADWTSVPNRITLFRLPLEEDFADPAELAEEVRITVIHELAHHLGIDDDRLEELGV
jgi:predicted Zn-dependent protease with MMP-like domain